MDLLIDDPQIEKSFKEILAKIRGVKNGVTVGQMKEYGLKYKMNWGASVISLNDIASQYKPNHILALKLWNKQWRETMILASMLDVPSEITEQQMDYWTRTIETAEIAEQLNMHLWVKTPFAFVKSLEWCRGKKHFVKYAGLHLMGRLAISEKSAMDEMFEPFFDVLSPLSKDPKLKQVFYRSFILLGMKSPKLNEMAITYLLSLKEIDNEISRGVSELLISELQSDYIQEQLAKNC